jgi:uncharacterized phage protein gp47/JayE
MSLFAENITPTGYVRTPLTSIKADLEALWVAAFGADADLDARSADGQIIGGLAEMFSDLEANVADTYQGLANPNGATGQFLTNIAGINGLARNSGMASYVPVTIYGTPSTGIPADTLLQSTMPDGTTATWSDVYTLDPGTGVQTPGSVIAGGGASANTWAVCTVDGATRCPAATPMKLLSVIAGLTTVTVTSDAMLGYVSESDPNLRVRRQNSFGLAARGPADALDAALNNMPAVVSQAAVWENNTGVTVSYPGGASIAPHSMRVIVVMAPNADQDLVAQKIYDLKPSGCGLQGAVTNGSPVDEQNHSHPVKFDVATPLRVYVGISLATRAGWPSDGAQQIANLIGEWSANPQNHPLGGDSAGELSWTSVLGSFLGLVPGFDLVTSSQYGSTPIFGMVLGTTSWNTGSQNLPLTFLEYATIAASDVLINGVVAFP